MSKSTLSKSRAGDKGGKGTSSTPAVTHDIIPGKYNDKDWDFMVDHEDGDEFIVDIVEEVCSSAMDIIFQSYIQKQLVPYTVCQAKDAILQIIEWQFLARDEGEQDTETDACWIQDEEPEPAVTDCWAQGSVPKRKTELCTPTPAIMEEDEEPEPVQMHVPKSPDVHNTLEEDEEEDMKDDEEDSVPIEEDEEEEDIEEPSVRPPEEQETTVKSSSKTKFKPYTGRLKSAGVTKMTESLEDTEKLLIKHDSIMSANNNIPMDPNQMQMPASCHSMIKLQAGRPPGHRDVMFDDSGNVIAVYKLDPEKLPMHKVKTGYRVIDPAVEAAQARLEAMRTGKYMSTTSSKVPKPPASPKTAMRRNISKTVVLTNKHASAKDMEPYDVVPLPPPLIDTISVAPGVVVKERDQTKKGAKLHGKKLDAVFAALQRDLRPIQTRAQLTTLTVAEILEHQTPVVKPLVGNMPIPPIRQQGQVMD